MRDWTCIVGLKRPNNFEALRENPDMSVITGNEEVVRAGTYGAELIALTESAQYRPFRKHSD